MYGVSNYISTYVAYNLGYTLSLNLDFQVYDSSLGGKIEEKEDIFTFKAEFDEEEIIKGEDEIDIILPVIDDLAGEVHDFTVLDIQEHDEIPPHTEEATVDEFDTGDSDLTFNEDEYDQEMESEEVISIDEINEINESTVNAKEEVYDIDEYEVEQKEEKESVDEYDVEQVEEIPDEDSYDLTQSYKKISMDEFDKEMLRRFEEEIEKGFGKEELEFRRAAF